MPIKPRISVFMPARNEQETIRQNVGVLKAALKRKLIDHAVIVLDGSRDATPAEIFDELAMTAAARRKLVSESGKGVMQLPGGVILISHANPRGKGRSFVEAVDALNRHTRHFEHPQSVLVNIDADALDLNASKITGIARELRKRKAPMILGQHWELSEIHEPAPAGPDATGFRAMTAQALKPLISKDAKWTGTFPAGLSIDYALNKLIYPHSSEFEIPKSRIKLLHSLPFKHQSLGDQMLEFGDTMNRFLGRPVEKPQGEFGGLAFDENELVRLAAKKKGKK